jgi:hypothetical protein
MRSYSLRCVIESVAEFSGRILVAAFADDLADLKAEIGKAAADVGRQGQIVGRGALCGGSVENVCLLAEASGVKIQRFVC